MTTIKAVKEETAQTTLDGKRVIRTVYRTEDEGPQSFSAGKLDDEGITFLLENVETHEGAYADKQTGDLRPFYTAQGENWEGAPISLAFGSKRLHRVLIKVLEKEGSPVMVNISGRGQGFDRNYDVKVINTD
ncbi:MAG: hypothetical protein PHT07_23910 [Paludibacter sp.]|nr:hypothetical protein [Paludibacter sp.]